MEIKLKDGSLLTVADDASVYDAAVAISEGLARAALCGKVNGALVDLRHKLADGDALEIVTFKDDEGKHVYRHTASHILAQAVKNLYPNCKLAIGPSIDNGFYYDIDFKNPITNEDLAKIEAEMKKIIKANYPISRFELPRDQAIAKMSSLDEPYKVELIEDLPEGENISFYEQGGFIDLCRGPHLSSTGKIKAFSLMSITGAYWRGNEKNKMLTRIYGTAFDKKSDMEEYFRILEEAKKRDHRRLGRELDLFDIYEEGPGFPFFMPKGMVLRNTLESYWREEHEKNGYQEIRTPIILNEDLWHRSGHWDHYKENMYFTKIDEKDYAIKPMNCPGGMLVFKRKLHSYRDLPQRMAELGLVHRHELSGALHGLMRVRNFTQDDAHIFMTPDQIEGEILNVITLINDFYNVFGFNYEIELSTRPEDSMGSDEQWEIATESLKKALEHCGKSYKINEGDGAFYGPKIDFHLTDSIGRTWQCGTIQLDFQMPERFDLNYIGQDGEKHRPVMIHRVVFGSIERFIAILTEHYAGAFPAWLAPVQVTVLPISEGTYAYAEEVYEKLKAAGLRVEIDSRNEKIGYRIREAQLQKLPYMLVLGEKEKEAGTVAVRSRKEGDLGTKTVDEFIAFLKEEIAEKR